MGLNLDAAIAANRFGLGARPDEAPVSDARRALRDQLSRWQADAPAWRGLTASAAALSADYQLQRELRTRDEPARREAQQQQRRRWRDDYQQAVQARLRSALETPAPFVERLVHFWSNHFAVSIEKGPVLGLAGAFEAEAIRPHVLGRFEDILLAVERHPAMLIYLDQVRSVGPDSLLGRRSMRQAQDSDDDKRRRGLNENLAREILELHTLGVRGGYSQADVTEFARALTGWSITGGGLPTPRARGEPPEGPVPEDRLGRFEFRPALHEPGSRRVVGRSYPSGGEEQGVAILRDLARSEATAQHLATKLARHFAGDEPAPALVRRLTDTFLRTGGDLGELARVLIDAPEAWVTAPLKFKTPWEWSVSALRALGLKEAPVPQAVQWLDQLGQPVWRPGSPAGWDDVAASWAAPDALMRRVELAARITAREGRSVDARVLASQVLPLEAGAPTLSAIARSESPASALALLLVSPEFLRR